MLYTWVVIWLLTILLGLVGLGLDLLALGTFAQLSSGAPLWLRSVGTLEGLLGQMWGSTLSIFARATLLSVLGSLVLGLAAYAWPRQANQPH